MKYHNGEIVKLNDSIRIDENTTALVVILFEENLYNEFYERADWNYLHAGALVDVPREYSPLARPILIHYDCFDDDADIVLIERYNDEHV